MCNVPFLLASLVDAERRSVVVVVPLLASSSVIQFYNNSVITNFAV